MQITVIAYVAAFFMLILLLWMLRDFFLPKKQEFYKSEMAVLDLLRRELSYMEAAINRHKELAGSTEKDDAENACTEVRNIYVKLAQDLAEISYDRNVFLDKGITWPGQRCYDIYLKLSGGDMPLGFCAMSPLAENNGQVTLASDQYAELCKLTDKFLMNKDKLLKRLEIYK